MTAEITDLATRAEQVVAGVVNSATRANGAPLTIAAADGAYVTDLDGKRYLDYHAAFGAILLGHHDPVVDEAVIEAIRTEPDLTGWGTSTLEVRLAEAVVDVVPSIDRMVTVTTGSEAVAYAVRIARAHTGRKLLVKVQGGFHGWSDAVARNVISPPDRAYGMDPLSAGILPEALEATLIAEYNDLESLRALFDDAPRPDRRRHRRADPAQRRGAAAGPRLPRGAARADRRPRERPDLRRGHHRLPARARRVSADRRCESRPHDLRQGHGQRVCGERGRWVGRGHA